MNILFPTRHHPFMVSISNGFHIKTVRSPIENRTFSIWKPYGFQLENIKRRQLGTDTEPFNHILVRICQANLLEKTTSQNFTVSFSPSYVTCFSCLSPA